MLSQIIKNVARGSWRVAGVSGSSTKGGKRCADWGHGVKILQVHVQAEHDRHTCQTQTTSCHYTGHITCYDSITVEDIYMKRPTDCFIMKQFDK
ncbi:hypothetical protein E2C01_066723 [Portunus trituberculatus]|uniref:Uncharacterized protein n=1 Tax=Portunus trituberculatus TaxID=210409 RepID=A0A5B7HUL7_PORTR|nr:hypothetical protein [Portunus trituberculatus]